MSKKCYVTMMFRLLMRQPLIWSRTELTESETREKTKAIAEQVVPKRWRKSQPEEKEMTGPKLFGLVKSKCFDETGSHKCSKVGHACFRRVSSNMLLPWKASWRTVGRAIQALLMDACLTWDTWSLKDALQDIRGVVGRLRHHRLCEKCGCEKPPLVIATYDAAQAFENLEAEEAVRGLEMAADLWRKQRGGEGREGNIWVSTSGRLEYSTKKEACHYTEVSLEEAINAMKGALQLSEVKFGDTVWKQRGLPTGGMISRQALSAALLPRERKWSIAEGGCESHAWGACRYVDDNLMIASGLCEPCLEQKG